MPRKQSSKTRLMNLPMENLLDILKRLPVKSVCCLRCVSKTLSDTVLSPFFVDLHTRFLIATNAVAEAEPQLVLRHVTAHHMSTGRWLTALESLNYDGSQEKLTPSETLSTCDDEKAYSVHFVFYDLICFKKREKDVNCFLINPLSGEVLSIPTTKLHTNSIWSFYDDCYGMGFDDITSTYKIVRICQIYKETHNLDGVVLQRNLESCVVGQLLVLGTNSWRKMPVPSVLSRGALVRDKSVCAHGDMHWLFEERGDAGGMHILSFDFKKEEFHLTPIPATSPMLYLHLITLRESVALVDTNLSRKKFDIWVMKDYNKKEWKREYVINLQRSDVGLNYRWNTCGEWEHGILFMNKAGRVLLFWDVRCASMKCVRCPIGRKRWPWLNCERILSLKRSLISLKKFGDLVEEPEIRWSKPATFL